jgi:hypothetical protein
MHITRRILASVVVLMILVASSTTSAAPRATSGGTHITTDVDFTLEAGSNGGCPQLKTAIHGTGVLTNDITVTNYPDGSRRIVDVGVSNGKATDANGGSYRYEYVNRAVIHVPAEGTLVIVEDTDSFTLRGGNRANRVRVSFHWLWTYQPESLANIVSFSKIGFPGLDPNATNVVKVKTISDPLLCDPI